MLFNVFLIILFCLSRSLFLCLVVFILKPISFATLFFSGVLEHLSLKLCSGCISGLWVIHAKSVAVMKAGGGLFV